jgi:hypothetical protein
MQSSKHFYNLQETNDFYLKNTVIVFDTTWISANFKFKLFQKILTYRNILHTSLVEISFILQNVISI